MTKMTRFNNMIGCLLLLMLLFPLPPKTSGSLLASAASLQLQYSLSTHSSIQSWAIDRKTKRKKKRAVLKRFTTAETIFRIIGTIAVVLLTGFVIAFSAFIIAYGGGSGTSVFLAILLFLGLIFLAIRFIRRVIWGKKRNKRPAQEQR